MCELGEELRMFNLIVRDPDLHNSFLDKIDGKGLWEQAQNYNKIKGVIPVEIVKCTQKFRSYKMVLNEILKARFGKRYVR